MANILYDTYDFYIIERTYASGLGSYSEYGINDNIPTKLFTTANTKKEEDSEENEIRRKRCCQNQNIQFFCLLRA